MKKWIILIQLMAILPLAGQWHFSGSVGTMMYSWENYYGDQQFNLYQSIRMNVRHEKWNNTKIKFNFREAWYKDTSQFDDRLYNFYLQSVLFGKKLKYKLGRQFTYTGVINGTIDGASVKFFPMKPVEIGLFAGAEVPYSREFEIGSWDKGNVLGTYLNYRLSMKHSFLFSYVNKQRNKETAWHEAGLTYSGMIAENINLLSTVNYNLDASELQKLQVLSRFYLKNAIFSAEFISQKPIVYAYSYFNIFEIKAYNQFRTAYYRKINGFETGFSYNYTKYDEKDNHELSTSIGKKNNSIGILYNNGAAGDNFGVYGRIQYPLVKNLFLTAYANYFNYQRYMIDISEHALSYSAGLAYKSKKHMIRGELQQMSNNIFKNDWRGFVQYNYLFNL